MAQLRTPVDGPVSTFTNRNLPVELRQAIRMTAAFERTTEEHICNRWLRIGMEHEQKQGVRR